MLFVFNKIKPYCVNFLDKFGILAPKVGMKVNNEHTLINTINIIYFFYLHCKLINMVLLGN